MLESTGLYAAEILKTLRFATCMKMIGVESIIFIDIGNDSLTAIEAPAIEQRTIPALNHSRNISTPS